MADPFPLSNESTGRRVVVLQHAASENLGAIENILGREAIEFRYVRTFEDQPVPRDLNTFSAVIVMGGPMGVYETDKYPFLVSEMDLMEKCLKSRKPVLGVCLGSQLLAACLGVPVRKGRKKEIGWFPVTLTPEGQHDRLWKEQPQKFTPFHWHGDVFDLPSGAVSLASSELTAVQAFNYGDLAYGLLFHLEVTRPHIEKMLSEFAEEVQQQNLSAPGILRDTDSFLPPLQAIVSNVIGRWAKSICRSGRAHDG